MKNAIQKALLFILAVSVVLSLNCTPAMAKNSDFTVSFVEAPVNEENNIYKLTISIKGYSNTAALDIAFVYDSTQITPIDADEYLITGSISTLDSITSSSLYMLAIEAADNEAFSLQLSAEISLDNKRNALSISAYNTAEQGFDLSTETEILDIYYQVVTGKDYFSVAATDTELFDIYGSVNGAGITIVAKNSNATCYAAHSHSTVYEQADTLNSPVFSYTNKTVLGDVNNDGIVNLGDVQLLFMFTRTKAELTATGLAAADINRDGLINLGDVQLLFMFTRGKVIL